MLLNLNADLGESFGPWPMGDDSSLLDIVNSANVACGQHAGDPVVMQKTIAGAQAREVDIGAHPGFPDLQGFGRRALAMTDDELTATVQYQIGALDAIARAAGANLSHVKPHGAMNNLACENRSMADTLIAAIHACRPDLLILAPVFSELAAAAHEQGARCALEVFADRAYTDAGHLVPRSQAGAVHGTSEECIAQVMTMIAEQGVPTVTGKILPTAFHSICVHGDNSHAVETAARVRDALVAAGHQLTSLNAVVN